MIYYFLILLIASCIRFPGLNLIPPGQSANLVLRIFSAFSGVISVGLVMLIIKDRTKNISLSLISGLILCFMPWHIEQSRVVSGVNSGLTLILFYSWVYWYLPCRICKIFLFAAFTIIFWRIYPSFWIFSGNWTLPTFTEIMGNLFKLISGEFLFFKNDTFWRGGLRTYGVMLPGFIPAFMLGIYLIFKKQGFIKYAKWYLLFIIIWVLSAVSPNFPESREYFLILPYLTFICALGFYHLIENSKKRLIFRILFISYFMFIIYEYILFTHFYTVHYQQRIKEEFQYAKINF